MKGVQPDKGRGVTDGGGDQGQIGELMIGNPGVWNVTLPLELAKALNIDANARHASRVGGRNPGGIA